MYLALCKSGKLKGFPDSGCRNIYYWIYFTIKKQYSNFYITNSLSNKVFNFNNDYAKIIEINSLYNLTVILKERGDILEKELDFEKKHQADLKRIQGFRLLDDDFMSKVFEDKDCAEFLLQIILKRSDLKVKKVQGQYDVKNLQGRSVRLDILAVDNNNEVYNIEVQRSNKGAGAKRARYNSSLIDANVTEPGDEYEALNETYVIFITENDTLKAGLPIYHVDRVIRETGELFEDESHIIYVNSQMKDDTELGKLMHDFSCTKPQDMYYKILADRVRYFKEDEKGVLTMCREMENMRRETAHEKAVEIAKKMLLSGKLTTEDIADFSGLTVEEVKALSEQKTA